MKCTCKCCVGTRCKTAEVGYYNGTESCYGCTSQGCYESFPDQCPGPNDIGTTSVRCSASPGIPPALFGALLITLTALLAL